MYSLYKIFDQKVSQMGLVSIMGNDVVLLLATGDVEAGTAP